MPEILWYIFSNLFIFWIGLQLFVLGKPLDLSLDSDVDGLASSLPDKNEDLNDDFDIIEDINERNQRDEIDNFSCEKKS